MSCKPAASLVQAPCCYIAMHACAAAWGGGAPGCAKLPSSAVLILNMLPLPACVHPAPLTAPTRRRWLAEPTWEAELAFWQRVCDNCKVILTPGFDCHAAEPGFFRLCFAWMPLEALSEAIGRLKLELGSGGGGGGRSA